MPFAARSACRILSSEPERRLVVAMAKRLAKAETRPSEIIRANIRRAARSLTIGDAPHGAFLRHFPAQNDAETTAMRHRFGQKRRRIAVMAKKSASAMAYV